MQYLGGKSKIAADIAEIVNEARGGARFWEPFCGGLSVSVELARAGPGIVSDACVPLISLYQAVASGWLPPDALTEREYYRARDVLSDSDPLKAFAGFACSFGGKWFGGYARSQGRNFARTAKVALLRDIRAVGNCTIARLDFLLIEPLRVPGLVIYADPPYGGTTAYSAAAFSRDLFWFRCSQWARAGVPIFVSEYTCPLPHKVVLEISHALSLPGGTKCAARVERLFKVLP